MANVTSLTASSKLTIGVDLGDKYSHYCVLDPEGEVTEQGRLRTTCEAFRARFATATPVRIVIEVGTHSPWVSRLLEKLRHEVLVANPRQLALISQSDRKDDVTDPELLARLARVDPKLLAPIQHRRADTQADLAVIRARDSLVRARTKLINHVRGAVKAVGGRVPKCDASGFAKHAAPHVPRELWPALSPLLPVIADMTRRIKQYQKEIEKLGKTKYPETELFRQVTGVGALTALAYLLVVDEPRRFPMSRTVGAYLGLTPRRSESGEQKPQLRITKAGDKLLRRLLVGSAQYILGPFGAKADSDLRRWGLELAARGGKNAKKRAAVAVARKLAVLLHRLWLTGEVYEPLRNANPRNT